MLPAAIVERVRAGRALPKSTRAQVAQLCGADTQALGRGRNFVKTALARTPMSNDWVDADGILRPRRAGDWFVSDDMTPNFPYWVEAGTALWDLLSRRYDKDDAEAARERGEWKRCEERFGCRLVRGQLLATLDCGTNRLLGHTLWSKHTDAYGCYAILWHYSQLLRDYGLPRGGLKHEGGSWRGTNVLAAMAALGVHVSKSVTPNSKPIEGRFNIFQDVMAAKMRLLGLSHLHLGKARAEFEIANKIWLACRDGRLDPRTCGAPHITEFSRIVSDCFDVHNDMVSHGKTLCGRSPQAAWEEHIAADGPLAQLSEVDAWRLKPGVSETRLDDGMVKIRAKEFGPAGAWYGNAKGFGALGKHYQVTVRYDLGEPDKVAVFSREATPTRMVKRGELFGRAPEVFGGRWTPGQLLSPVSPGEFLCFAELSQLMPAEVLGDWSRWKSGHIYRKEYARVCRAIYQATFGGGRRSAWRDEAHDGAGNSRRLDAHSAPLPSNFERVSADSYDPAATREARERSEAEAGGSITIAASLATVTPPAREQAAKLSRALYGAPESVFDDATPG
jgi:hypothetical protein